MPVSVLTCTVSKWLPDCCEHLVQVFRPFEASPSSFFKLSRERVRSDQRLKNRQLIPRYSGGTIIAPRREEQFLLQSASQGTRVQWWKKISAFFCFIVRQNFPASLCKSCTASTGISSISHLMFVRATDVERLDEILRSFSLIQARSSIVRVESVGEILQVYKNILKAFKKYKRQKQIT